MRGGGGDVRGAMLTAWGLGLVWASFFVLANRAVRIPGVGWELSKNSVPPR